MSYDDLVAQAVALFRETAAADAGAPLDPPWWYLTHNRRRQRRGAPSPPPLTASPCPVQAPGPGLMATVAGRPAGRLKGVRLRAVAALIEAFPGGLTRDQLNSASRAAEARAALQALVLGDVLWAACIRTPRHGGDYRLPHAVYRIATLEEVEQALGRAGT